MNAIDILANSLMNSRAQGVREGWIAPELEHSSIQLLASTIYHRWLEVHLQREGLSPKECLQDAALLVAEDPNLGGDQQLLAGSLAELAHGLLE